jgi:hypothetical protein
MSNLLEKASILLTPTAYDDGKVLSVKPEDGTGDFDFTRNSSATRVNSQGLIEDMQILSGNLVSNGDFSQEGAEEVVNGDFANGSTDWNLRNAWVVSNGICSLNPPNSDYLSQSNVLTSNKSYKLTFDIIVNSGNLQPQFFDGGWQTIGTYSTTQTVEVYFKPTSSGTLYFKPNLFDGSITNVSIKEVGQDWTLGTGWSIGDDIANASGSANANISQNSFLTIGNKYKVTYTVLNASTGARVGLAPNGSTVQNIRTENGTYTEVYEAVNTSFYIRNLWNNDVGLSVSNISVVEITEDTNLPRINYEGFSYQDSLGSELVVNGDFSDGTNGWNAAGGGSISVSNNQLTLEGNNDFNFYARQAVLGYEVGKQYRIEVDVAGGSTSKMQVGIYGEGLIFDNQPIVLGKLSAIFTITSGSNGSRYLDISNRNDDGLNDTLIINSVSVKEYLGQEVVPDSGCGSWLFEQQSTNLVTYSEDYNTGWSKQQGIISDGGSGLFYLSPTSNVIKYEVTAQSYNQMYYRLPSAVTIGTTYTQQGYVKCDDAPYIHFQISAISSNTFVVWDNINNVVVSAPASVDSYNITSLNGWVKAEITYTAAVASIYASLKTYFSTSPTYNWTGIPIGTIAYQTFVQVEALSFATSYIPTSGSTATRLGETAKNAGGAGVFNSEEGVLYAEIARLEGNTSGYREISISDGTTSNSIKITLPSSNVIQGYLLTKATGSVLQTIISFAPPGGYQGLQKIAFKYKEDDFALWVNGVEVATSTSGGTCLEGVIDTFNFNRGNPVNIFYGKTKCVAVFKEALTDEELECLTTI